LAGSGSKPDVPSDRRYAHPPVWPNVQRNTKKAGAPWLLTQIEIIKNLRFCQDSYIE
jgi:hypothetical protein